MLGEGLRALPGDLRPSERVRSRICVVFRGVWCRGNPSLRPGRSGDGEGSGG